MSDYIFLIILIILLLSYLFYFKEKLMKWEERDSIEKSYANRLTAILVAGILLWIYKIMNS
jgi:Tfp pilus assembly protein PilO